MFCKDKKTCKNNLCLCSSSFHRILKKVSLSIFYLSPSASIVRINFCQNFPLFFLCSIFGVSVSRGVRLMFTDLEILAKISSQVNAFLPKSDDEHKFFILVGKFLISANRHDLCVVWFTQDSTNRGIESGSCLDFKKLHKFRNFQSLFISISRYFPTFLVSGSCFVSFHIFIQSFNLFESWFE